MATKTFLSMLIMCGLWLNALAYKAAPEDTTYGPFKYDGNTSVEITVENIYSKEKKGAVTSCKVTCIQALEDDFGGGGGENNRTYVIYTKEDVQKTVKFISDNLTGPAAKKGYQSIMLNEETTIKAVNTDENQYLEIAVFKNNPEAVFRIYMSDMEAISKVFEAVLKRM